MIVFKALICLFIAIALLTGAADLMNGLAGQFNGDAAPGVTPAIPAAADNIYRFFAGLWFGVGLFFALFLSDLRRYRPAMIMLFVVLFIGGCGRLLSIWYMGMPEEKPDYVVTLIGLVIELLVGPAMAIWLLRRDLPETSANTAPHSAN